MRGTFDKVWGGILLLGGLFLTPYFILDAINHLHDYGKITVAFVWTILMILEVMNLVADRIIDALKEKK